MTSFPIFKLKAVVSLEKGKEFAEVSTQGRRSDRWKVVFFWPKDFTFVCPTEIAEFGRRYKEFTDRDTEVFGVSHDNEYVHLAWRRTHPDLKDIPYPMLADVKQELSGAAGVIHKEDGVPLRATFLVDPTGHHPARQRERPVGRPQRGRAAAPARRLPDRRAVPLQLAARAGDPGGGLDMTGLDAIREALPEAAKDIKLNLRSVLQSGALSPAQRWGVAIASAIAARNPRACGRRCWPTRPPRGWTRR